MDHLLDNGQKKVTKRNLIRGNKIPMVFDYVLVDDGQKSNRDNEFTKVLDDGQKNNRETEFTSVDLIIYISLSYSYFFILCI